MQAYQLSHWEYDTFFKQLDLIIIGTGIVGLSAAIAVKEKAPKMQVLAVDRGPLPIGASTRNAGFACFGSLSELLDDLQHSHRDEVLTLVEQRFRGLMRLRQRYSDQALGYYNYGGYELFRPEDKATFVACQEALAGFNQDLASITGQADTFIVADDKRNDLGLAGIQHLLLNQAEGQLHTGQLMNTLMERARELGVRLIGGITIQQVQPQAESVTLQTEQGWEINARHCLITTNGFTRQLLPQLDVQPARNQVLITAPLPHLPFRGCFHYNQGYIYFRNVGNRILLGGGRHLDKVGETTQQLGSHPEIRQYLLDLLHNVISPQQEVQVERWWSGIMGVGPNKRPIIQSIDQHITVAVRLGGMGVALGTELGEQAAALVLGK